MIHLIHAALPPSFGRYSFPLIRSGVSGCLARFCLAFLMILLAGGPDFAMEWPDESERVVSTFGAAGNRHFQRGLEFKSEGQLISSWEAGEVIWTDDAQSQIPSRGVIAVEHQNGFRSVYLGIKRLHNLELDLENGQWLGYARGETWRFEIIDRKLSKLVNPIFILPARSEISFSGRAALEVLMPDGSFATIQDGITLSAGLQTIVINGVFPDENFAVPARISFYWIGQSIVEIRINALRESGNEIVLETPKPLSYESVFGPNNQIWFPDIHLNEGRGELELRIEDEVDRVFTRSWSIDVQ